MNRTQKNTKYNPLSFINILRILAAFGVFLIHYHFSVEGITIVSNCPVLSFLNSAFEPVGVFFVISGVLFFFAYYGRIKDDKLSFKDFFLKRIIRLWPLMVIEVTFIYVFFLITYFAGPGRGSIPEGSLSILEYFMAIFFGSPVLFTGANTMIGTPTWYITVLMFSYLIAYLLTKLDKKINNKLIFLAPLVLGGIMIVLEVNYPFFNFYEGRGLFAFFLGFYVGFGLSKFSLLKSKTKIVIRLVALIFPVFFIVIFNFPDLRTLIFPHGCLTGPLTFTAPLFFVLYDLKLVNKIGEFKPIKYLSNLSYDFYMLHGVTLGITMSIGAELSNQWYVLLGCLLLAIVVAAISYHFVSGLLTKYFMKKLGYEH